MARAQMNERLTMSSYSGSNYPRVWWLSLSACSMEIPNWEGVDISDGQHSLLTVNEVIRRKQ